VFLQISVLAMQVLREVHGETRKRKKISGIGLLWGGHWVVLAAAAHPHAL
jgi:hypothetical protein